MDIHVGTIARTPFPPSGLVEVLEVEALHPLVSRETVLVRFLAAHPHGYPSGSLGRYFRDELRSIAHWPI